MRFVSWTIKGTNTHSKYAILTDFSTTKIVKRTHLKVTFIRTLLVLLNNLISEVLTAVLLKIQVFWDVVSSRLVKSY